MKNGGSYMRYKILVMLAAAILTLCMAKWVFADESADSAGLLEELSGIYGEMFNSSVELFEDLPVEIDAAAMLGELNSGRLSLSPTEVANGFIKLLWGEVYACAKLMAAVIGLSVLTAYLSGLKTEGGSAIADCAFFGCYIVISGIAVTAFCTTADSAATAVEGAAGFMRIAVPMLIAVLVTSGASMSAAVLEPTVLGAAECAVWLIETVFIPGTMISAALGIVNGMSDRFKTDRMIKLLNSGIKWGMTIMLTVFVSLAGLKSIASAGVDGLTLKLGRFAASNLIPMVGGLLAESLETVMNCGAVIKNSVGVLGIIFVVLIVLKPMLKLGALLIVFRVTAALAEPIAEPRLMGCISRLGDSIGVLLGMVAVVAVMFIITIAIIINAGGSAVMLGR